MKDQKGVTLVELLAALAIAGLVIVPLLTVMTGTFTRTITQGKESQLIYYAQEVMEEVRQHSSFVEGTTLVTYCIEGEGCQKRQDWSENEAENQPENPDAIVRVITASHQDTVATDVSFLRVDVIAATWPDETSAVELVTVVNKDD